MKNQSKKINKITSRIPLVATGFALALACLPCGAQTPFSAAGKQVGKKLLLEGVEESAERAARDAAASRAAKRAANGSRAWDVADTAAANGGKILAGGGAGAALIIGTDNMTSPGEDGKTPLEKMVSDFKGVLLLGVVLGTFAGIVWYRSSKFRRILNRKLHGTMRHQQNSH